jgi:hypothetical protein
MSHIYLYLKINSLYEIVDHYHTFFFNVFLPIILKYIEVENLKHDEITFVIGDNVDNNLRILLELPIDIKLKFNIINYDELDINVNFLIPVDVEEMHTEYDYHLFSKGWAIPLNYDHYLITNQFMKKSVEMNNVFYENNYIKKDVIYIKNIKSDDHVKVVKNNHNIKNNSKVENLITKLFTNLQIIDCEYNYMSIFAKYKIFNDAKIIIGQYGSELSHIVFANPNAIVIEIVGKSSSHVPNTFFKILSGICKIKHYQYITEKEDTDINTNDFELYLNNIMKENNVKI